MGWFSRPKTVTQTVAAEESTAAATEEKKEAAKSKARLLSTQGENNGAELTNKQGASVRRIFG